MKKFFARSQWLDRSILRPLSHIMPNWELTWDSENQRYFEEERSFAKLLNELIDELGKVSRTNVYLGRCLRSFSITDTAPLDASVSLKPGARIADKLDMKMFTALCALMAVITVPVGHAQATKQEKAICVEYLTGTHDPISGDPALQPSLREIDSKVRGLVKVDSGADEARSQADQIAVSRKTGLDDNPELAKAESVARFGEKSLRIKYCGECTKIKAAIEKIEKDVKARCPLQAQKIQGLIDEEQEKYTESCVNKKPYDKSCKFGGN